MKALYSMLVAVGVGLFNGSAMAQNYPSRPIKIVVGYTAGGGIDVVARLLAQKLATSLAQPVIVENRPGASGTLATNIVAKSAPDGYTLLLSETAQISIARYVYKSLPYDSVRDLAPIAMLATVPIVLVANPKMIAAKNLHDLAAEARDDGGKLDYGTVGIGSIHHIAMEVLKQGLDLKITHIPYKGGAMTVQALVGGQVPLIYTSLASLGQFTSTNQLIAVSSAVRLPSHPNVPTVGETVKGYDYASEMGLMGPAGVDPEIIRKLSEATKAAIASPEFEERSKALGFIQTWTTPEIYTAKIKTDLEKFRRAVAIANIIPE